MAILWLALTAFCCPASARADGIDLLSRETVAASADLRLVGADGERSWLDGDFGKARFGGGHDGDFRLRPEPVEASVAWLPKFGWALSGTVVAVAQKGQQHDVDLSEAFFTFRPAAGGPTRFTVRAGLFWPPVSLEHEGFDWHVTDTITPSAIGSWIGEEVKVVGSEGSVAVPLGAGHLSGTAALFGVNDTSGTLLAFRGWALGDEKAVAFGKQPLPPLNAFITPHQPRYTRPVISISDRIGFYAKLAWSPPLPLRIEAFHYDNRARPEDANRSLEWGWRTRFDTLGAVGTIGRLTVKAQGLRGRTAMGFVEDGKRWVNMRFRSAYLMVTRQVRDGAVSARIEAFGTRNHGSELRGEDDEDGWAATLAGRHAFGDHLTVLAEIQRIDSRRDARLRLSLDPRQRQTIAQAALRARL